MPKISMPLNVTDEVELRPAIDEIQDMINHIEFILEGRIDNENIWNESGQTMSFSASKINDLAINTKPIEAPKFFSTYGNEVSPYDKFQTLLSNVNDEYRVLEGKGAIILNKDNYSESGLTTYIEIEKPRNYILAKLNSFIEERLLDGKTAYSIDLGNDPDSVNIASLTGSKYAPHTINSDYVVTYDFFADRFEAARASGSRVVELPPFDINLYKTSKDSITFKVDINSYGAIEKDEFFTLVINMYVLCKELV